MFDHALRIRLKAETSGSSEEDGSSSATTPANEIENSPKTSNSPEAASTDGEDDSETLHSRTTTGGSTSTATTAVPAVVPQSTEADKGSKAKKDDPKAKTVASKDKGKNLVGKINNLVTSDLGNITDGRDFLFVGMYGVRVQNKSTCLSNA